MDYTFEKDMDRTAKHLRLIVRNMIVGVTLLAFSKGLLWLIVLNGLVPPPLVSFLQIFEHFKHSDFGVILAVPFILLGIKFFFMVQFPPQNKPELIEYKMRRKATFYQMIWWLALLLVLSPDLPFGI